MNPSLSSGVFLRTEELLFVRVRARARDGRRRECSTMWELFTPSGYTRLIHHCWSRMCRMVTSCIIAH